MTSEETDIAVVGAGGGGAVLALALAQKGIKTVVLEQAPGPPSGLRGEILQPNGQRVLDQLGLLNILPADATRSVRKFHFCRVGGERLCTVDYSDLPPPYNRAVVSLPNVAHHAILNAIQTEPSVALWYGTSFTGLLRENGRVSGLTAKKGSDEISVKAKVVVGADGAVSKVREALGISADLHLYPQGYLIAIVEIVDDSPSQLLGMKRVIEKLGHEPLTAEDGAAGVEAARRELPDLILMDVVMPNLNGFQATRAITKDPLTAHIPIVLVTTKDQETDKVWGLRQGAKAYITKPFNEAHLMQVVNELLAGKPTA